MEKAILLYDDKCKLCNKLMQFTKNKLKHKTITFIPLSTDKSKELLEKFSIEHEDSIAYIQHGTCYLRSEAIIQIFSKLILPYRILKNLAILPAPLLDHCYNIIARIRSTFNLTKECCDTSK